MVVLDSWQYFGHQYMHINKFLYRSPMSMIYTLRIYIYFVAKFDSCRDHQVYDLVLYEEINLMKGQKKLYI